MESSNLIDERMESFRSLFPEAFTEGKIDFPKLREALGDFVEDRPERYSFSWAGKRNAIRLLQTPSRATLKPAFGEGVFADGTPENDPQIAQISKSVKSSDKPISKNLFIEGDNLEVLKLLYKSYAGRVKMIYIDPPYNTGKDFIYPDNFADPLDTYLRLTGQKDAEGNLMTSNPETSGRYHSAWLSMMYPRLFIARQLLREDGVIFVSIDDHEVHNLRLIMNEIFGEENFEGHIHWRRRHNQPNDPTKMIAIVAEHIISYSRNTSFYKKSGVGKIELTGDFSNPDNDPRGDWASKPWKVGSDQSGSRYIITTPTCKEYDEEWMGEESTYKALLKDNRIIFPGNGNGAPRKKYFKFEREREGQCATNWWPHDKFGHNQGANIEMTELMGFKNVFSNPKPSELIKNLISIAHCEVGDIILDFFAGSCVTYHSVILKNACLQNICIQIPEPLDPSNSDHKAAIEFCISHNLKQTIAEIGKERIRRVIKKMKSEHENDLISRARETPEDLGFRVFKLDESNYIRWTGTAEKDADELVKQMELSLDPLIPGWKPEDVLWEIAIKEGLSLTSRIEKIEDVKTNSIWRITDEDKDQSLLVCLDNVLEPETPRSLNLDKETRFICRDIALTDELAANLALQCRLKTI